MKESRGSASSSSSTLSLPSSSSSLAARIRGLQNKPENLFCSECSAKKPGWLALLQPENKGNDVNVYNGGGIPNGQLGLAPDVQLGALVCFPCSNAIKKLGSQVAIVKALGGGIEHCELEYWAIAADSLLWSRSRPTCNRNQGIIVSYPLTFCSHNFPYQTTPTGNDEQVCALELGGNKVFKTLFEGKLTFDTPRPNSESNAEMREIFVRSKYVDHMWINPAAAKTILAGRFHSKSQTTKRIALRASVTDSLSRSNHGTAPSRSNSKTRLSVNNSNHGLSSSSHHGSMSRRSRNNSSHTLPNYGNTADGEVTFALSDRSAVTQGASKSGASLRRLARRASLTNIYDVEKDHTNNEADNIGTVDNESERDLREAAARISFPTNSSHDKSPKSIRSVHSMEVKKARNNDVPGLDRATYHVPSKANQNFDLMCSDDGFFPDCLGFDDDGFGDDDVFGDSFADGGSFSCDSDDVDGSWWASSNFAGRSTKETDGGQNEPLFDGFSPVTSPNGKQKEVTEERNKSERSLPDLKTSRGRPGRSKSRVEDVNILPAPQRRQGESLVSSLHVVAGSADNGRDVGRRSGRSGDINVRSSHDKRNSRRDISTTTQRRRSVSASRRKASSGRLSRSGGSHKEKSLVGDDVGPKRANSSSRHRKNSTGSTRSVPPLSDNTSDHSTEVGGAIDTGDVSGPNQSRRRGRRRHPLEATSNHSKASLKASTHSAASSGDFSLTSSHRSFGADDDDDIDDDEEAIQIHLQSLETPSSGPSSRSRIRRDENSISSSHRRRRTATALPPKRNSNHERGKRSSSGSRSLRESRPTRTSRGTKDISTSDRTDTTSISSDECGEDASRTNKAPSITQLALESLYAE